MMWTRPMRIFVLLGFACIAASTAGALFALHPRNEPPREKEKNPAYAVGEQGVVCYGLVDVEGGITALTPLQPGRVVEVKVHENDSVKKDDVLLRMDRTLAEQRLREAKADLASAEAQLRQAEALPAQHEAQLAQQKAAVEAAQQRTAAVQDALAQKQELLLSKSINKLLVNAAAKLVEEAKAGVQAEQEKLKQLQSVDPSLQIARAKADADAKRARMAQADYALKECELKAPSDGDILQVQVNEGSVLSGQSGVPAILFVPSKAQKPRIVRAEVEQEFADRLSVGQAVTVKDEARREKTWSGKVKRISNWYSQRRSSSPDTLRISNNDVHVLECIIELTPEKPSDAKPSSLRMGQRVRVSIGKN